MSHFVAHLEGAIDGTVIPFGSRANLHNNRPIWVRYHLDRIRAAVTPADIAKRPPTLWRYRELLPLPLDVEPVTLGEGMTPLLHQFECHLYGAKAFRVNGLINDCGKIVKDGAERMQWFDLSTLKEPYR